MIPHIAMSQVLTIVLTDGYSVQVTDDHHNYKDIIKLVEDNNPSEEMDRLIKEQIAPRLMFQRIFGTQDCYFTFNDYGEIICIINDTEFSLDPALARHILKIHQEVHNLKPLYNFVMKLARNPRKEVIDEMWGFLQACGMTLEDNGNFLAYKAVQENFKDIHTGQMDNSPGSIVQMERFNVEHDPRRTCAAGLHFAAWEYLTHFSSDESKILLLSISPEDVVSIPHDYNNQKGRAHRYKVLREVKQDRELDDVAVFIE